MNWFLRESRSLIGGERVESGWGKREYREGYVERRGFWVSFMDFFVFLIRFLFCFKKGTIK